MQFNQLYAPLPSPVKLVDGLYLGDQHVSSDLDFLHSCQVAFVVNCAGNQIHNEFEGEFKYITFMWSQQERQLIFSNKQESVRLLSRVIQQAKRAGVSVLVHAAKSFSRSSCLVAAWFMYRYRWSLYKTFQYLNWRKPDLEIKSSFFRQLTALQNQLLTSGHIKYSSWDQINLDPLIAQEQIIIKNTYINAKKPSKDIKFQSLSRSKKSAILWKDSDGDSKKLCAISVFSSNQPIKFSHSYRPDIKISSILKGSALNIQKYRQKQEKQKAKRPSSTASRSYRQTKPQRPASSSELRQSLVNNSLSKTKKPEKRPYTQSMLAKRMVLDQSRKMGYRNVGVGLGVQRRQTMRSSLLMKQRPESSSSCKAKQPIKIISPALR